MTTTLGKDRTGTGELPDLLRHLDIEIGVDAVLPIAEVAGLTGNTQHTLRYYERIGLVEVGRDGGGRRAYSPESVSRILFISRLRASAMPIRDIRRYVETVGRGDGSRSERLALLEAHRGRVRQQMAEMQSALDVIDFKITMYAGGLAP